MKKLGFLEPSNAGYSKRPNLKVMTLEGKEVPMVGN
jgi:hypothetical protein